MYAIRSYYVLSEVESASYTISYLEALAQMTLRTAECYGQNENEKLFKVFCEKALVLRITSYNVCYTKLLREIIHTHNTLKFMI